MMAQNIKHKNNKDPDSMVTDKALNIAQGIKQEKQTKAQTKLVAQGIGKGIEIIGDRSRFLRINWGRSSDLEQSLTPEMIKSLH